MRIYTFYVVARSISLAARTLLGFGATRFLVDSSILVDVKSGMVDLKWN